MWGGMRFALAFVVASLLLGRFELLAQNLGDTLTQGWQAEQRNDPSAAASAYAQALSLRPDNPLLHLKYAEMLILLDRPDEVARHLVQALTLFSKDAAAPVDLKRYVCDLLMGRLPQEMRWRRMGLGYDYEGWLYPPFATLPVDEQKRISQLVPKEWLFPTKASEAGFLLSIGEGERGLTLLQQAAMEGDLQTAIHVLMSRFVTDNQRVQIVQAWRRDAERSGNPFLWLANLRLLWRTRQMDAFRADLPKALAAMKGQPALLREVANLCEQMRWDEGLKQVGALLPSIPKPLMAADARKELNQALEDGDLAKVKALARTVAADFPDDFLSIVLDANTVRKILRYGWHELVMELVQPEIAHEVPYDTKELLLRDAAFHPARFSHWLRLFMSRPFGDVREWAVNLLATTANPPNDPEPERSIWLLEQGLLVFPDEPRLTKGLALAYERAGYPHRAITMLKEVLLQSFRSGVGDYDTLSKLWDIAHRTQQLPELVAWLEEQRAQMPLGMFVAVAQQWWRHNKPAETLRWLDGALAIAKERDWLSDAEIQAQVYQLLRSPDPQAVSEGMSLQKRIARTAPLFHPDTYELRLRCLVHLGKTDEAKRVLDETKGLYPTYPFVERVQGLAKIAVTDWDAELRRQMEKWRELPAPNYPFLVRLAHATVKAGRSAEAEKIADELMAAQPLWREGYLRAVALFSQKVKALVPFVRWVQSCVPKNRFAGWLGTVEPIGHTIRSVGEGSLYGAFMIAAVLLATTEKGEQSVKVQHLIEIAAPEWWVGLNAEDKEALKAVLEKERLNPYALNLLRVQGYVANFPDRQGFQAWLGQLQKSQTQSANSLLCQLNQNLSQATREGVRQWIAALQRADWSDANWCPLTYASPLPLPKKMVHRGFREEAIALLQIALKHAPPEKKPDLMAQLTELTGKPTELPKGEEAKDGKAWLTQAQGMWRANRKGEARQAALKALELNLPLNEQAEALRILSEVDTDLALQIASERLPNFLFAEPNSDPPMHLRNLADVLYRIAEKRKDLAPKVAPLLDRAANFSPMMQVNTFKELALVHLWAGNTLRGVTALFDRLDKGEPQWNLRAVIGVMVRADIPADACRQITEYLGSYLQTRRIALSLLADELDSTRELGLIGSFDHQTRRPVMELTPDGLKALAEMLQKCVAKSEGVIPREFLGRVLWQVKNFAVVTDPFTRERVVPDEVTEAWWQLFETAVRKAIKTPADAQSLKQWLGQFWLERPDTAFSQTVWYERLKKLAETLQP